MGNDLELTFFRRKYPDASEEFIEQQARSLARKLSAYTARAGKTCARCGEHKAFSEFGSDVDKADGLTSRCRTCRAK